MIHPIFLLVILLPAVAQCSRLDKRQTPVENEALGTPNLVHNGSFTDGTPGWTVEPPGFIREGMLCVVVPAGTAPKASYIETTQNFTQVKNDIYYLNFTASASHATNLWIQTNGYDPSAGGAPVDPNLNTTQVPLTTSLQPFSFPFSPANQENNSTLTFFLDGSNFTNEICLGDISLHRINRLPYHQDVGPAIKANQHGYLPNGPKTATVMSQSNSSLSWNLLNSHGTLVMSGQTHPFGNDTGSGRNVHTIDFTNHTKQGSGYTLEVAGEVSYPFAITSTLYTSLRQDSMEFFYQQRSGIAIDAELVGYQYARPAGHINVFPNQGDVVTPCQYGWESNVTYLEPWTCNYTLDVSQGWYDAGDQGKYVVNGGISTAQILMAYERSLHTPNNSSNSLGDGSLKIPERSNGYPDFLDEARWEMEFMLKMQVPQNSPPQLFNGTYIDMSGMVHHKMHDNQWTQLPTPPHVDPKRRELHRPSTAATLNMVATAATSARLWAEFDSAFAQRCLDAARIGYAAAKANPAIYAPGTDWDLGGGAYSDDDVRDEFYWAAAELYITTSEAEFEDDVTSNYYHTANVSTLFPQGGFGWSSMQTLAQLDLAAVSNNITGRDAIIESVMAGAEQYMAVQKTQPTGVFITSYPWGSNSNQLNCIQVVATAYDISRNTTYRTSALSGMDYIFGRNALSQSYVHDYGTKTSSNMHSRLFANELSRLIPQNPIVPPPPKGAMAGGANESPDDPPANDVLKNCVGQFCYVDDVNSYSTNEVAINWGSALAWVASWAADQ
ncbi:Six-hairpin glycosidase [Aureobasidium pullulans]|uniref:cellulase n=1 Tax=Aureobasidium pullulans TaxID=5580 RepID=A0A4S8VH19_AURPU|nr:Six-hairpin glycosidase [Aureobasidium pullulans]THW54785.1 Six-hairpin glycosidase [Aureobasidium pullulans]